MFENLHNNFLSTSLVALAIMVLMVLISLPLFEDIEDHLPKLIAFTITCMVGRIFALVLGVNEIIWNIRNHTEWTAYIVPVLILIVAWSITLKVSWTTNNGRQISLGG